MRTGLQHCSASDHPLRAHLPHLTSGDQRARKRCSTAAISAATATCPDVVQPRGNTPHAGVTVRSPNPRSGPGLCDSPWPVVRRGLEHDPFDPLVGQLVSEGHDRVGGRRHVPDPRDPSLSPSDAHADLGRGLCHVDRPDTLQQSFVAGVSVDLSMSPFP